ncbi:substrate-binding domain-containing protein [Tabrizicola sp.]|uniref:substrate-binding domain-containing protein n=1 Tax=Tabrizicola sp. TaxID=2005166 RepID=UPI003F3D75F8
MRNVLNYTGGVALRAIGVAAMVLMPSIAFSEEVTLKSADGTVNLVGEFVEFNDDNYVIRTALGELRIAASRVRCEGASCPVFETATANVRIAGSDTVGLGLMPLLMSGYAGYLNAEATITNTQVENQILASFIGDAGFGDDLGSILVTATRSGDAFKTLLDGSAQIGMSSRRITPEEARALRDAQKGNMVSIGQEHIIAVDSLVLIVNPANKMEQISIQDLQRIYSGEVTNWSQLGGEDLPITVITRAEGSGTLAVFNDRIFGENAPAANPAFKVVDDNNEVASLVNETPGAIGYVGYAFQRGAKPLVLINECGIPAEPDPFSAKTEEYALQRRLYLYTTADADEATKKFVEFTQNEASDAVVAKAGFIDLGIKEREQSMESPRAKALLTADVDDFEGNVIREMLGVMSEFDRLSTTFRFRLGSTSLDERGIADMKRLVDYLAGSPEGTKVTMVGFTDDIGAFESNLALSRERARQVVDEVKAAGGETLAGIEFDALGYGVIAPSACNSSEAGRAINRRVEVWISRPQG